MFYFVIVSTYTDLFDFVLISSVWLCISHMNKSDFYSKTFHGSSSDTFHAWVFHLEQVFQIHLPVRGRRRAEGAAQQERLQQEDIYCSLAPDCLLVVTILSNLNTQMGFNVTNTYHDVISDDFHKCAPKS